MFNAGLLIFQPKLRQICPMTKSLFPPKGHTSLAFVLHIRDSKPRQMTSRTQRTKPSSKWQCLRIFERFKRAGVLTVAPESQGPNHSSLRKAGFSEGHGVRGQRSMHPMKTSGPIQPPETDIQAFRFCFSWKVEAPKT